MRQMQSSKSGKLPKMTDELQTAYNEWLIKYGFNPVPMKQLNDDNMYPLVCPMHGYKPDDLLKRTQANRSVIYQLKTPEEIKNENPTKAP